MIYVVHIVKEIKQDHWVAVWWMTSHFKEFGIQLSGFSLLFNVFFSYMGFRKHLHFVHWCLFPVFMLQLRPKSKQLGRHTHLFYFLHFISEFIHLNREHFWKKVLNICSFHQDLWIWFIQIHIKVGLKHSHFSPLSPSSSLDTTLPVEGAVY